MGKVKWGVLGAAEIARECVIPAMQNNNDIELWAIASRSMTKANYFKEEFGFSKAYSSYQDLINDPEIEVVYIPLPNSLHKEWTIKAAEAGKNVLCEKPLSTNKSDVIEMFNTCESNNVIIQEGFAYLHSPLIQNIKFDVESGVIGELKLIESVFFTPGYPDDNVTVMRETYGGALYDIGCYNISIMNYLLNKDVVDLVAVAHFTHLKTDDFASAWIDFGDCRGVMMTGMCSPQRADRFILHGTEGSIEVMLPYNVEGEIEYKIYRSDESIRFVKLKIADNYGLEIQNMNESISNKCQTRVNREFSIRQADIMDRILDKIDY